MKRCIFKQGSRKRHPLVIQFTHLVEAACILLLKPTDRGPIFSKNDRSSSTSLFKNGWFIKSAKAEAERSILGKSGIPSVIKLAQLVEAACILLLKPSDRRPIFSKNDRSSSTSLFNYLSLIIALAALATMGCKSSEFTSSGQKNGGSKTPANGQSVDAMSEGTPPAEASPSGSIGNVSEGTCVGGASHLNLVLVFDKSGSQDEKDQQAMAAGASAFLSTVGQGNDRGLQVPTRVSVIRFSRDAEIAPGRWQNVQTPEGMQTVARDIAWANEDNGGGTVYHKAIGSAASLFAELIAVVSDPKYRNFVVFLSDGKPNDEEYAVMAAQRLVNDFGVAFISIGVGLEEDNYLRQMASLKNPKTPAEHVGHYFDAERSASSVAQAFRSTESAIRQVCR